MLANLRVSQWTARKLDKRVSGEVAKSHNVQANVGAYYKSVLPTTDANGENTAIERIKRLVTEARTYHYKLTLPWFDSGARVLSAAAYFDYMQQMQGFKHRFEEGVTSFVYDYPFEREEAKLRLGTLFNDDDYPPLDRVAERFSFALDIMPIPMGTDFRCDIGDEEAEKIRSEIEKATLATAQRAVTEVYKRVASVVEAFACRLQFEDTRFEKSLVGNAVELVDLLPKLNFTGDPTLAALGKTIKEKLCVHEVDELRNNLAARRETYGAALEIKKDLAAFFGSYQKENQNG
jgi:hypothetical protein